MGDRLVELANRLLLGLAVRCASVVTCQGRASGWWRTFAWERSFVHAPGSLADWENARLRSLFSFLRFADIDVKRFKVVKPDVCFVSQLDTLPL